MRSAAAPPTLVDLFAPPGELRGIAGALCGFSASARFLEKAMLRFTGMGGNGRQHDGERFITLFLDPRVPPFRPMDVVGLYQPHPRAESIWMRRAKCMHAKVALLAFGRSPRQPPDHFRIVVSTGNWTEEAASRSLDLVWSLDVAAGSRDDTARADLAAAARFFENLSGWYEPVGELPDAVAHLVRSARSFAGRSTGPSRFLSSFDGPMIDLLTGRLEQEEVRRRNVLLCGSGFFEAKGDGMPVVLRALTKRLQAGGVPCLAPSARGRRRVVVVNPGTCGAVMRDWVLAGGPEADGWTVHAPADPLPGAGRSSLHAKFVFLATHRKGVFSGGWLLLGSGNLSPSGFLRPVATAADEAELKEPGNIEAGVLFPVQSIPGEEIGSHFPIGLPLTAKRLDGSPPPDEDEEDPKAPFSSPPPIVAVIFDGGAGMLEIVWSSHPQPASLLLDGSAWIPVELGTRALAAPSERPGQVPVRWRNGETAVPVIGTDGSWCRVPFSPRPFEDLMDRLLALSVLPPDDNRPDDENDPFPAGDGDDPPPGADRVERRTFAAHRAMRLVETIADRKHRVEPEFLQDWFRSLHFLLQEGPLREQRDEWRALGVNFLACLDQPGFAPPPVFQDAKLWKVYRALLEAVAENWGLAGLPALSAPETVDAA